MNKLFYFFVVMFFFNGCKTLVGIKDHRNLSDDEIVKYAKHYKLENTFKIDTAYYHALLKPIKTTNPRLRNDLYQPLQIKIFNSEGKMIAYFINCNIGGFPNLKWNAYGSFDSYPPDMKIYRRVDTTFTLNNDVKFYQTIAGEKISESLIEKKELVMIVYWSRFMNRQSKRLIKLIQSYKTKFADKKIETIFVNVDNLY